MCLVLDHHRQGFGAVVQPVTVPGAVTGGFQEGRWQDVSAKLNKDPFCVRASTLYVMEGRKETGGQQGSSAEQRHSLFHRVLLEDCTTLVH